MSTRRLGEDEFDRRLSQALRRHSESVPAGFTGMVLKHIGKAEEQRILARVVLQERLALAACIALVGTVVVVAAVVPEMAASALRSIATGITGRGETLIDGIPQTIEAFSNRWQLYTVLGIVFGFTVYSLVELFVGDRLRIA